MYKYNTICTYICSYCQKPNMIVILEGKMLREYICSYMYKYIYIQHPSGFRTPVRTFFIFCRMETLYPVSQDIASVTCLKTGPAPFWFVALRAPRPFSQNEKNRKLICSVRILYSTHNLGVFSSPLIMP